MGIKIPGKMGKYGIIRHNPSFSPATAFKADGPTNNQWTNPVLVTTDFRTIYFNALSPKIDPGSQVDYMNLTSQVGLNKELSNLYIDKVSNLAKFNFSMIADKNTLSAILAMAFQAVTVPLTGDNSFYPGFKAGPIDFNGNGGYTFGLCEKIGASADDGALLQNGIMDSVTFVFDFLNKGVARLAQINGTMAFKSVQFDKILTGTFVETTLAPIGDAGTWIVSTFSSDSVDLSALCIRRLEITINNKVSASCATTDGAPNQFDCDPEYLCNIVVDHGTLTEKLRNDFVNGATVALNIKNQAGLTTGYFEIDIPVMKMKSEPSAYNGDFYGYNMQMEVYQDGTDAPMKVRFLDALDWGF